MPHFVLARCSNIVCNIVLPVNFYLLSKSVSKVRDHWSRSLSCDVIQGMLIVHPSVLWCIRLDLRLLAGDISSHWRRRAGVSPLNRLTQSNLVPGLFREQGGGHLVMCEDTHTGGGVGLSFMWPYVWIDRCKTQKWVRNCWLALIIHLSFLHSLWS